MRYRSKPSEIEAVQWTGENEPEVWAFGHNGDPLTEMPKVMLVPGRRCGLHLLAGVDGAQGWVPVPVGHWIVHAAGDKSNMWPVDPDYFAEKYEPVE